MYLDEIYGNGSKICCNGSFSDVVLEDPIPDMSTLLMLIGEMAPAQRPLR